MGKGSSGHKMNEAAKRNRARYVQEGRSVTNKARKAGKQKALNERLLAKGKGPLVKRTLDETLKATNTVIGLEWVSPETQDEG